ncbi:MAG: acyloxyacyl hydrolase [Legionellales bacterium]|nr:acyloxyacyl hydrolase [Legionellales bacterium]
MKLIGVNCHASIACILLISSVSVGYAGTMGAAPVAPLDAYYIGVFGGGGAVMSGSVHQQGTALYPYGPGSGYIGNKGPLAVNAIGTFNSSSAWLVGGHVGYRWPARLSNDMNSNWTFAPATELEGYYIGGANIYGDDLNNATARLVEHDFHVTYPLQTGVVLANAVLNANHSALGRFHPYVGVGVGLAVVSISGANSTQKSPPEPGINHYNSDPNDVGTTFAAQPKIGVSFDLSQHTSMFVEYRFLYLAASNYTFGSTSYPTHVATTNWDVKIGSQYYNMGSVGFQFDL